MIEHAHLDEVQRLFHLVCDPQVRLARLGDAGWVVMGQDAGCGVVVHSRALITTPTKTQPGTEA